MKPSKKPVNDDDIDLSSEEEKDSDAVRVVEIWKPAPLKRSQKDIFITLTVPNRKRAPRKATRITVCATEAQEREDSINEK